MTQYDGKLIESLTETVAKAELKAKEGKLLEWTGPPAVLPRSEADENFLADFYAGRAFPPAVSAKQLSILARFIEWLDWETCVALFVALVLGLIAVGISQ